VNAPFVGTRATPDSYDGAVDHIPLARAAALAYERLFPDQGSKDSKTLDMIALALSSVMPLYQRDMASDALRRVDEAEIAEGRFTRGATTVEFAHRPPLRYLVVSREGLGGAIEKLMTDSLSATLAAVQQRRSCSNPSRMS
jgi:hypothetical protein